MIFYPKPPENFIELTYNAETEPMKTVKSKCYYLFNYIRECEGYDENSDMVRKFKDKKHEAEEWFFEKIKPYLGEKFCIARVPPHCLQELPLTDFSVDPIESRWVDDSPFGPLSRKICRELYEIHDATICLQRHKPIIPLSQGGDRSIETHLNSIKVQKTDILKDKDILLLDDVVVTGNSMIACHFLLAKNCARNIECLAFSRRFWTY